MDPSPRYIHASCDGATPTGTPSLLAGVGVSLSDEHGEFLRLRWPVSPALRFWEVEGLAVLRALEVCAEIGAARVTVRCDCLRFVQHVTTGRDPRTARYADIIQRTRRALLRFEEAHLSHVGREENWAAHGLAREATTLSLPIVWLRKPEEEGAE